VALSSRLLVPSRNDSRNYYSQPIQSKVCFRQPVCDLGRSERFTKKSYLLLQGFSKRQHHFNAMKFFGLVLIVVGIACFVFLVTVLFAWTTPVPGADTPSSLADILETKMIILFVSGTVCTIAGFVALVRGVVKSRDARLPNTN